MKIRLNAVLILLNISSTLFLFSCKTKEELKVLKKHPNIIYILTDDLGYGDISAFNPNGKIKTRNIDLLASEGMKFIDAHTSSAVCTPTRYGILTGRYNWRSPLKSGVLTGKSKALIPNNRTTVASLLKKEGYSTAFIGKWHLGWNWALKNSEDESGEGWNEKDFNNIDFSKPITNSPNDIGFDYAYGHSGSLDMAPYVYAENRMATEIPDTTSVNTSKYGWWRKGPTSKDFIHEDVTPNFFRKSFNYIKEKSKEDKPFLLYLALPSPHTPILPSTKWQGKSNLNPYGDFVLMVDDYVGQLLKVIKETGIEENTLVIFTSDNGCSPQANFEILEASGHNPSAIYRGHKADIYEGGHRVPFIAKWPTKIKAGTVSNATLCTTDFMATCAAIVNRKLEDNEGEDSFSLLPLFNNTDGAGYLREATVHHSIDGSFAIRKNHWKMIFCPGSGGWSDPKPNSKGIENLPPFQLYNLSNDPGEKNNLYGKHPEISNALKQLMSSYIENGRSNAGEKQQNESEGFDKKDWKQLKNFYN